MDLWTDGDWVVQHVTDANELRVFRGGSFLRKTDGNGRWKSPLAVDPAEGWILLGTPGWDPPCQLVKIDLETLERGETFDVECYRVVALGDGRVAAVVRDADEVVFVVGTPGQAWDLRLSLDIQEGAMAMPSLVDDSAAPGACGRDVNLTVNEYGVGVADGQAGLAALWRPGDDSFAGRWTCGGNDQSELFTHATPRGILCIARYAARDALVHHLGLDGTTTPILGGTCYGAHGGVADGQIWIHDDNRRGGRISRVTLDGFTESATAGGKCNDFVQAADAASDHFVLGFGHGIYLYTVENGQVVEKATFTK
jgi:hypothetical protein